ncbi:acidic proline-rich protein PRP25-like [Hirundo rustica]|uniref:acidic proline-rich protein PRP25-like n=1 Tax=Hirundo rustica TaxID=43150 RepID=UPI001A944EA7|nr:acidic proline-rich protein PRP25-like [Hirundo rustica]
MFPSLSPSRRRPGQAPGQAGPGRAGCQQDPVPEQPRSGGQRSFPSSAAAPPLHRDTNRPPPRAPLAMPPCLRAPVADPPSRLCSGRPKAPGKGEGALHLAEPRKPRASPRAARPEAAPPLEGRARRGGERGAGSAGPRPGV